MLPLPFIQATSNVAALLLLAQESNCAPQHCYIRAELQAFLLLSCWEPWNSTWIPPVCFLELFQVTLWNYSWDNRAWEVLLLEGLPLLIAWRVMLTRIRLCAFEEHGGWWCLVYLGKCLVFCDCDQNVFKLMWLYISPECIQTGTRWYLYFSTIYSE
jgi:hypothetical protein